MERVVEPAIADLQTEYEDAIRRGREWKSRWVRLAGYVALLKVIAWCGCGRALEDIRDWTPDDGLALGRTLGYAAVAVAAAMVFLEGRPLFDYASRIPANRLQFLVYLAPGALPIAVPSGRMVGILCGLRQRVISRRLKTAVLATAIVCSIGSFAELAWLMPAANQAFRVSVSGQPRLTKGLNELTFHELQEGIETAQRTGVSARPFARMYYTRWALIPATSVLALFGLAMVTRLASGRFILGLVGCGAVLAFYALMSVGDAGARSGMLPAFASALLPNGGIVALSAVLLKLLRPRGWPPTGPPRLARSPLP